MNLRGRIFIYIRTIYGDYILVLKVSKIKIKLESVNI